MPKRGRSDTEMREFRREVTTESTRVGGRQYKDLNTLKTDLKNALKSVGLEQATEIGLEIMNDMQIDTPIRSGRLSASGFLFINGKLVAETGGPIVMRGKRGSGGYGVIRPDNPSLRIAPGTNNFQIDVIFHTPKKVKKGKEFYIWKGRKWFDYAIYVLDNAIHQAVYRESIQRARQYLKRSVEASMRRHLG